MRYIYAGADANFGKGSELLLKSLRANKRSSNLASSCPVQNVYPDAKYIKIKNNCYL